MQSVQTVKNVIASIPPKTEVSILLYMFGWRSCDQGFSLLPFPLALTIDIYDSQLFIPVLKHFISYFQILASIFLFFFLIRRRSFFYVWQKSAHNNFKLNEYSTFFNCATHTERIKLGKSFTFARLVRLPSTTSYF